ncbi:MAG TPA: hypothetical protein VFA39_19050 [Steroidobacteraceae bacterium]|nr:hypothetical protein [Steroidobacteraceae bacterium]
MRNYLIARTEFAAYFARFFGFFFGAALPCGFGGVLSILRSTSSGFGLGLGFSSVMAGV